MGQPDHYQTWPVTIENGFQGLILGYWVITTEAKCSFGLKQAYYCLPYQVKVESAIP